MRRRHPKSGRSGIGASLDALLAEPTPDPDAPPSTLERTLVRSHLVESSADAPATKVGPTGDEPTVVGRTGDDTGPLPGRLVLLPVEAIQPNEYQPRRRFDEEDLAALTDSVRELGVLQPILVRRREPTSAPGPSGPAAGLDSGQSAEYELIAGERRWRAARRAGLAQIPAVVRSISDLRSLEEAIVENLHRTDLNPLEEAAAFQQLIDEFGLSQSEVAHRVGKSRSAVANTLRLNQLPPSVQRMLAEGTLSAGHARAVLSVSPLDQREVAERIVAEDLSVRQAEQLAARWSASSLLETAEERGEGLDRAGLREPDRAMDGSKSVGALEVEAQLSERLSTRVQVTESRNGGRIVIEFADADDFVRIYEALLSGK